MPWRAVNATVWLRLPRKNGSAPAKSTPVRCWTMLAKAVSISCAVPAFKMWSCSPSACVSRHGIGVRVIWIHEHGGESRFGDQLVDQGERFLPHVGREKVHACNVAARPVKARDQAEVNRIGTEGKDNRNSRSNCLGGLDWSGRTCRKNHGHLSANQIGG